MQSPSFEAYIYSPLLDVPHRRLLWTQILSISGIEIFRVIVFASVVFAKLTFFPFLLYKTKLSLEFSADVTIALIIASDDTASLRLPEGTVLLADFEQPEITILSPSAKYD